MQSDFFTSSKMNFHRVYLDNSFNKALNSCRFKRSDQFKNKSLNHLDLNFDGFNAFECFGDFDDFDCNKQNEDITVKLFADVKLDIKSNAPKSEPNPNPKQNNSKPKDDWSNSNSNTSSPWKFVDKKSNPFSDASTNNKCSSSSRPIYVGFPSDVKPESLSSCLKTNQININKEELKKVNDTDFIKFCETKLDTVVNTFNAAKELRTKMRKELESNVNREVLQDFKTLVNITNNPLVNAEKINILTNLLCKYANKFKD